MFLGIMDTINALLQHKYTPYIVGGAVVLISVTAIKRVLSARMKRMKRDISKYPRDKIILFQLPRCLYAPSFSPFPLKLETYLRMANIPYENEMGQHFSTKGKTPFIVHGGDELADSHFCIQYLNRVRSVDLNSWLTDEQRAVARAFQMMTEDHLFWVVALSRWCFALKEPEANDFLKTYFGIRYNLIVPFVSKGVYKQACAQGIGRHTKDEALSLAEDDLRAISKFLGKKPFLMGDYPCEEDCSLFGMLGQIYWQMPGPLDKLVKGECRNLGDYCERMKERFWPDWEECITHGGTKKATK